VAPVTSARPDRLHVDEGALDDALEAAVGLPPRSAADQIGELASRVR